MRVLKAVEVDGNAPSERHKVAVLAAIDAAEGSPAFEEIRAACGLSAVALPDGAIHQIALDAGFKVEG